MARPFCLRVSAFPFGAISGVLVSPGPIIRSCSIVFLIGPSPLYGLMLPQAANSVKAFLGPRHISLFSIKPLA